jgi:hypothetical protein
VSVVAEDEQPFSSFGQGAVACPACNETIPVPVLARITRSDAGQELETKPDMTELWAHTWAHENETKEEK